MGNAGQGAQASGFSRRGLVAGAVAVVAGGLGTAAILRSRENPAPSGSENMAQGSARTSDTEVRFTATGATFTPVIELMPGSETDVVWVDEASNELGRGTSPTIDFGSAAKRTVRMRTDYPQVLTINLGFSAQDDAGEFSLDSSFDKPPEAVSGLSGLGLLTNLRRVLAAHTQLAGSLDLSGLARLEHVECFASPVEAVDLTGCDSLVRLCLEECALTTLDLKPVSSSLRDFRAAAQSSGRLRLAPLEAPLKRARHFCVRDQSVEGHPMAEALPSCQELWNWNTQQSGHLPTPGDARSVMAYNNAYTSADLTGQWRYDGGWGLLDLSDNRLASVKVDGCRALQTLKLGGNALSQAVVDGILAEVDSWGTPGFELVLDGSNEAPSQKGLAHAQALRDRGWAVSVN